MALATPGGECVTFSDSWACVRYFRLHGARSDINDCL